MKQRSLTEGSILGSLLSFAFPVLFALFLQAMYGAVDLLIVGKFAEVADQSGVATGSMFMNLPTMALVGLAMGVTVLVAQAIGMEKPERAGRVIGTALWTFGVLAAILTAVVVPFAAQMAALMHAPQEAFAQTTDYIRICGAGMAFILSYNVLGAVFRGIGDSRTPLFTVAVACVFNIAGDLLLVAGLHMGAAGAALATVLAQAFSVIVSLLIIRNRELPFSLGKKELRPSGELLRKILAVGLPLAVQDILVHFSFMFIQMVVNDMDVTASAGVGVAEKVCAFLMLVGSAYMQSMSAFVAQNNGARQHDRARKGLFYGMATSLAVGTAMGCLAFFGGSALAAIFSPDEAVIACAHEYLKAYAIDCILTAIFFCLVGYLNGCQKSFFVMIQGLIGAFCVRIPVVYFMSRQPGVTLFRIGLGTPASSLVQVFLCVGAFVAFEKKYEREMHSALPSDERPA